ncbi:Tetratricopeptide-like helical [Arthroderma uncinatum]|uniref:Tetratricopeptide-like helical n=1 Tax=Arthroderma uncinatum TaxID=74035 RepID=UPI00144A97D0|nr:Tetratricopeptide-like helical [Arthroderma uncinatum]KAF3481028.1 Tetratricopeptide-like helical [Arthroderma uncinatum]
MCISAMAVTATATTTASEPSLWQSACEEYAAATGITLTDERFPRVQGPQDLARQLECEESRFEDFRMKRRPLFHAMQLVLAPFETWGSLVAGVAAAAFPPASSIMGAMLLLVRAANRVSDAFNGIVDLFHKLGNFSLRLDSYKGVPLSEGMKTIIVKVLVNFLRVCAASQKLLGQGSLKARLSKWAKNILVDDTSVSSLLGELEELTGQEHLMVAAHGLSLTHQALRNTEELLARDGHRTDRERLERVKAALDPVSASGQVFSSITQNRIPGSGRWVEERLRSWWQDSQPLLWIHGGPGVGKSHLASKIINDLADEKTTAVASFFFKNNDVDLRSLNKALRTLAWQLATQQTSFAVHSEEFCMKEDLGDSYVVWEKLVLNYFTDGRPSGTAACLVIDGIDEAQTEEQEVLFSLLENAFSAEGGTDRGFPLRIVLLSRDSVRGMLDEHSLGWIPEIEVGNSQNEEDLHQYISQKLQKTKLFGGSPGFREEMVNGISRGAEGLWEWANLVIKSVLRCRTKEQIRKVVRTLPRGISAMLTEELQRLGKELLRLEELSGDEASDGAGPATQIEPLNVLLSFVTLAPKPLTVRRLDIILELILKEEFLNLEDDIRTIYSSLFSIRDNDDPDDFEENGNIVTLRHSSFYEFFKTPGGSGPIHVDVDRTQAEFVYVCLYALKHNYTPYLDRYMEGLGAYADNFLPSHLSNVDPEKVGKLRGDISPLLVSLFSPAEPGREHRFIQEMQVKGFDSYTFYPTCELTELGSYWLDAKDPDTANKRAEIALSWLLPNSRQMFVDHARSSALMSDACSFTILLSLLVESWSQRWLEPGEIKDDDGLPAIAPAILTVYNEMMATGAKQSDIVTRVSQVMCDYRTPSRVLIPAESQRLQQTPMWHARVAQALLLRHCYEKALDHFQIALDGNQQTPTFSTQSLSLIHGDMARTCTGIARHKEALKHLELSESLRSSLQENAHHVSRDIISHLLYKAQMKHSAKLIDDAIATAVDAWELLLRMRAEDRDTELFSFFLIFLELNQPHRLRPVLDLVFSCPEEGIDSTLRPLDFDRFFLNFFVAGPRVMYRVLHHTLSHEDQRQLDATATILKKVDTEFENLATVKYLLSTVLFEKGRTALGIQGWYEIASLSKASSDVWDRSARILSIGRLVDLCLNDTNIPLHVMSPLVLDENAELGDICLILSSWLRDRGDIANSRDALRWCVKECISLLSDDDPSNDIDAFMRLFRTFLADRDSDEDLGAVLYLIKQDTELGRRPPKDRTVATTTLDDTDLSGTLNHLQLKSDQDQTLDDDMEDDMDDAMFLATTCSPLTECMSCKQEIGSGHHWYFCRSCPFSTLCWQCYRQFESDEASKLVRICKPGHKFYYTGPLLRPSECVLEGMVPLVSPDGEKRIVWVEEWKDRLAVKWETADFVLEGGLSAWCMRVLPEPQRSRWATFFQI